MTSPLKGSTALVTGASAGIGKELARELATRASRLVLVARRADRLEELAAELRGRHPSLDVRVEACDVGSLPDIERLGGKLAADGVAVDVLVNNAGLGDQALFAESEWDRQHQMLAVNVLGLVRLTHLLTPGMVARRHGAVLNVGSGAGFVPLPANAVYAATKHFVRGFTESLRTELRPFGIQVTQLCPGPVRTEFQEVAGIGGTADMVGGLPDAFVISAAQCAKEAVSGLERDRPVVFPGAAYGFMMRMLGLLPYPFVRMKAAGDARKMLSAKASSAPPPASSGS